MQDDKQHERIQKALRSAHEQAQPWLNIIIKVRDLERPTYEIKDNQLTLVSDGLSDQQHQIIQQCEQAIQNIYAVTLSGVR